MPLLNFLVFSSFPTIYSLESRISSLGLAHGACILFQKKTYEFLGGHKLVKDSLFEDTELAKKWRSGGEVSVRINGINIIKVRMYDSFKNIWLGFEKNSYPAFKNNFYFFTFHIFNFIFFSLPIVFLPLHILKINENTFLDFKKDNQKFKEVFIKYKDERENFIFAEEATITQNKDKYMFQLINGFKITLVQNNKIEKLE